jgi:hypothetical protein
VVSSRRARRQPIRDAAVVPPGERRFESFVHLVDVSDTSALVAWGGFFLHHRHDGWIVVDDDDLEDRERRGGGTIGAASPTYGDAVVEVLDAGGEVVTSGRAVDANHAWVEGLQPDTEYRYRILVEGQVWAEGERWDWQLDEGGPLPSGRSYDLRFRTHPAHDQLVPVTFLAFGDYGVGITNGEAGRRQQGVARTMEKLSASRPVRFLLGLGDNIYHGEEDQLAQSGDEDDDWYLTFYEPYRYLLDHLPMYPAAGNHDGWDEEASDDRQQLADNFHLEARFQAGVAAGRATLDPGLFYALRIGGALEIVCVDTTWGEEEGTHHFAQDRARRWLAETLPAGGGSGPLPVWRVPFCHHPAFCAGPRHRSQGAQVDHLLPLYRRAGVHLLLSGHEHNFQHGVAGGLHQIVSGAAGKLEEEPPFRWDEGGTLGWASEPHCLLVEVDEQRIVVTPYGATSEDEEPRPITVLDRDGAPAEARVVIDRIG